SGQQLKLSVEGRRATVELLEKGTTASKVNLTTVDFGAQFLLDRSGQSYPRRLRIEPVLRRGLGESATENPYTRFSITGNYHQQMLGATEFDVTVTGGVASSRTPVIELLSYGGTETVRGFRRDDVLGRRLWSVQPEMWMPLPGSGSAVQGAGLF